MGLKEHDRMWDDYGESVLNGDIVEGVVNKKKGTLRFVLYRGGEEINLGIAFSKVNAFKKKNIYPAFSLHYEGECVELLDR